MQNLKEFLFRLCGAPGVAGCEAAAAEQAARELSPYARVETDALGNVVAHLGKPDAKEHILLDAHNDQIGLIITGVDKDGFLCMDRCGGVDRRVVPGAPVLVYGREVLTGIVSCMPPHLMEAGEKKLESVEKLRIDVGLSREEAEQLVSPGDRALLWSRPASLLGSRVTCAALDDRCGAAALIRCAELLQGAELNCQVTILLSAMEEIGGQGARVGAYAAQATRAIAVDVSFAHQPGVPKENTGVLGGGPMIGIAPILNREMARELTALAEKLDMPHTTEVMGGRTSTNSDELAVARGGVRTALVSIPLRYMHTAVEVIDLRDVEYTARLLAEYVKGVK